MFTCICESSILASLALMLICFVQRVCFGHATCNQRCGPGQSDASASTLKADRLQRTVLTYLRRFTYQSWNCFIIPSMFHQAYDSWSMVQWAESQIASGFKAPSEVQQGVADQVSQGGGRVDYVVAVDAENLQPLEQFVSAQEVLVAVAALFGTVRLIDNVVAELAA